MAFAKTWIGFAALAMLCAGCQTGGWARSSDEKPHSIIGRWHGEDLPQESGATAVEAQPANALAELVDNKFEGPWTMSRVPLGPDRPAFKVGDVVKAKTSKDGSTMTVEYVPTSVYVDARYYSESTKESFTCLMLYRCRWKNKDGSESVGKFREEELAGVPVAS